MSYIMNIITTMLLSICLVPGLFAQHVALENTRKDYNVSGDVKQIKEYEVYSTIYPDGTTVSGTGKKYKTYLFNTAGNLTEISYYEKRDSTFRLMKSEIYTYDKTNKLIRVEIKDTASTVLTKYDIVYTTGRVSIKKYESGIFVTNEACTLNDKGKFTYRLTMDASGKELYTVSYTYNASGQLIRMTEKEKAKPYEYHSEAYVYGNNGQLIKTIHYRNTIVENEFLLEYDSLGQVIYWDSPNEGNIEIAATYTYDQHNNWITQTRFAMLERNMPIYNEARLGYRREILYYSQEKK